MRPVLRKGGDAPARKSVGAWAGRPRSGCRVSAIGDVRTDYAQAARAGHAGKGLDVVAGEVIAAVAGEVKDLAQQTARATEEVLTRIQTTQTDTAAATMAISQIGEIIGRIDALQMSVASAVEEQSATTAQMVRNVTEVATGSEDISTNIAGIATAATETTV